MATLVGPAKLEAKIRYWKTPWSTPLTWLGVVALALGASEDSVVRAIAPWLGCVIITCLGVSTFHVLDWDAGDCKLRKIFTW